MYENHYYENQYCLIKAELSLLFRAELELGLRIFPFVSLAEGGLVYFFEFAFKLWWWFYSFPIYLYLFSYKPDLIL